MRTNEGKVVSIEKISEKIDDEEKTGKEGE